MEPRVPGPQALDVLKPANEVAEEHEAVGERSVAGDEALVRACAERMNGCDDTSAPGDLERLEELGQAVERLVRELGPDELRVAVRQARSGQSALVDERERGVTFLPRLRDERHLLVVQLRERADAPASG